MLKVVSTEELCEAVHEVANGWKQQALWQCFSW
jgi:hypothetical protein